MASATLFSLANRLRSAIQIQTRTRTGIQLPTTFLDPLFYSSQTHRARGAPSVASRILPLGHPSISIVPVLDTWVEDGNQIRKSELTELVRDLRRRRRYKQALEASEWMKDKGKVELVSSDHAVHLDLIGQVHGHSFAESYFIGMDEKEKNEKLYGALLNCYVREKLTDKALTHFQRMKEMGFVSSAIVYNDIMCLYTNIGQHEKVPTVLSEMKVNGVLPDNFSYRICINAYGTISDIEGMESIFKEMKHQPQIVVDWNTYSVVAKIYIKAGLTDKAISTVKKLEDKIEVKNGLCYNHLITHFASLGNKSEMWRIWELLKAKMYRCINRDYICMLSSLVKLGEIEEAEKLLREWETSTEINAFDFRVPNVVLIGYLQKGLLEKAEAMLDYFLKKGRKPPANTWAILAVSCAGEGETVKAYEFMLNALSVYCPNSGWYPNSNVVRSILNYLGDEGGVVAVEVFVGLLRNAMPVNRYMYHTLIKANIRAGREIDELLKKMKADGIDEDEETQKLISETALL